MLITEMGNRKHPSRRRCAPTVLREDRASAPPLFLSPFRFVENKRLCLIYEGRSNQQQEEDNMSVSKLRAEAAKRDKEVAQHNASLSKHTKGNLIPSLISNY